jgi:hypothetical protein
MAELISGHHREQTIEFDVTGQKLFLLSKQSFRSDAIARTNHTAIGPCCGCSLPSMAQDLNVDRQWAFHRLNRGKPNLHDLPDIKVLYRVNQSSKQAASHL